MERESSPAEFSADEETPMGWDAQAARILTDLEIAKARLEDGAAPARDPLAAEIRALRRALSSLSLLRCASVGLRG